MALLNGAALVLPDHLWAPSDLADRLTAYGVTVMDLTPSYWRAFLSDLSRTPADLAVRLTIVGGSAVHAEDCRTALRLMPHSRLVNAYGLTETTITSCTMEVTSRTLPAQGRRRSAARCRARWSRYSTTVCNLYRPADRARSTYPAPVSRTAISGTPRTGPVSCPTPVRSGPAP